MFFPVILSVGFPFQLIAITSAAGNGASLSVYQHLQPRTLVIYELHGVNGFVVADFYHSCFLLAEELSSCSFEYTRITVYFWR